MNDIVLEFYFFIRFRSEEKYVALRQVQCDML